jgi:hypothetical protein
MLDNCCGFKFLLVNIMAGHSKEISLMKRFYMTCCKRMDVVIFLRAHAILAVKLM